MILRSGRRSVFRRLLFSPQTFSKPQPKPTRAGEEGVDKQRTSSLPQPRGAAGVLLRFWSWAQVDTVLLLAGVAFYGANRNLTVVFTGRRSCRRDAF